MSSPTRAAVPLDADALARLAGRVWATVVDGAVAEDRVDPSAGAGDVPVVVGRVDLHGVTACRVDVQLSGAAAREVAAHVFQLAEESVADADAHDAAGEVANMVGGVVKSGLTGEHRLSLPSVVQQDRWPAPLPGQVRAQLRWRGHRLLVGLAPTGGGS